MNDGDGDCSVLGDQGGACGCQRADKDPTPAVWRDCTDRGGGWPQDPYYKPGWRLVWCYSYHVDVL